MPEGHLIHRTAREQNAELSGQTLTVTSPQGRFDPAPVDGRRLEGVEAHGKHLFLHFDGGRAVHVHLGMRGLWLRYEDPQTPARGGTRMRLAGSVAYDLIAPTTCEVLDGVAVPAVKARLGPDPLRPDADPAEAVRRLLAARGPVAAAVADQAVWSGIGNAWRAELLWLARINPGTPAFDLSQASAHGLWDLARAHLALGRDAGQVVSDPNQPDERWVYKREACRSCGTTVATAQIGGRTAYWCPVHQPSVVGTSPER